MFDHQGFLQKVLVWPGHTCWLDTVLHSLSPDLLPVDGSFWKDLTSCPVKGWPSTGVVHGSAEEIQGRKRARPVRPPKASAWTGVREVRPHRTSAWTGIREAVISPPGLLPVKSAPSSVLVRMQEPRIQRSAWQTRTVPAERAEA